MIFLRIFCLFFCFFAQANKLDGALQNLVKKNHQIASIKNAIKSKDRKKIANFLKELLPKLAITSRKASGWGDVLQSNDGTKDWENSSLKGEYSFQFGTGLAGLSSMNNSLKSKIWEIVFKGEKFMKESVDSLIEYFVAEQRFMETKAYVEQRKKDLKEAEARGASKADLKKAEADFFAAESTLTTEKNSFEQAKRSVVLRFGEIPEIDFKIEDLKDFMKHKGDLRNSQFMQVVYQERASKFSLAAAAANVLPKFSMRFENSYDHYSEQDVVMQNGSFKVEKVTKRSGVRTNKLNLEFSISLDPHNFAEIYSVASDAEAAKNERRWQKSSDEKTKNDIEDAINSREAALESSQKSKEAIQVAFEYKRRLYEDGEIKFPDLSSAREDNYKASMEFWSRYTDLARAYSSKAQFLGLFRAYFFNSHKEGK